MADQKDKQYDPTAQRIRKAREDGNVFRAKELVTVMMLLIGVGTMLLGFGAAFDRLEVIARGIFVSSATRALTQASLPLLLNDLAVQSVVVIMPLMVILAVTAIGMNLVQSGWNVSFKVLEPKPDKISPIKGLKRIFSSKGLWEFGKGLSKILIVGPLAYLIIQSLLPEILTLHLLPLASIFPVIGRWLAILSFSIILVLLALSAADFAFEKWKYKQDLKMDMQEIKDEQKESEGNPEVKRRRMQMARELVRRPRLDHAVLQADVVVTNPTHYAVALKYDPEQASAPFVLVKGIRKRALRIKELAREHEVPTVEDRPLARALYYSVEEEQEIPEDLYAAVAALLAEIYRQRES